MQISQSSRAILWGSMTALPVSMSAAILFVAGLFAPGFVLLLSMPLLVGFTAAQHLRAPDALFATFCLGVLSLLAACVVAGPVPLLILTLYAPLMLLAATIGVCAGALVRRRLRRT
jgi:hypothetical protein